MRVEQRTYVGRLCREDAFAATVPQGEEVSVWTPCAMQARLEKLRGGDPSPFEGRANHSAGPLRIEGARAGEGLLVEFVRLAPESPAYWGGEELFELPVGEEVDLGEGIRVPARPMLGVVGVLPAEGEVTLDVCGATGGNMDLPFAGEGCTLLLPVEVDGGGLVLGDAHAVQGEGEVGGQGAECAAEVTFRARAAAWPEGKERRVWYARGQGAQRLTGAIGFAETLDEAARTSILAVSGALEKRHGWDWSRAQKVIGNAGRVGIAQLVCRRKTCFCEVPAELLPLVEEVTG